MILRLEARACTLRSALVLLISMLMLTGCGSSRGEFVYPSVPVESDLHSLTVHLVTASPVNARISGLGSDFLISLYDARKVLVKESASAPGQNTVFTALSPGTYWVRVLGLDSDGQTIGYFDREVLIPQETSITIRSLLYTKTPPSLGSATAPFLAFTQFPDSVAPGTPFTVELQAYNSNGTPNLSLADTVALNVTGADFEETPTPSDLVEGLAIFQSLNFTTESTDSAILTASGANLGLAVSPPLTVTITPPVEEAHLAFSSVPPYVVSGESFPGVVTVEARGEGGELASEAVEITLSLVDQPAPPEGAELTGVLSTTTVDGVAVFTGLTFTPGGEFALSASAPEYASATSDIITSEVPYSHLVVGDYQADRILSYTLDSLNPGLNSSPPSAIFGSDFHTPKNYDLASALNGEAIWFLGESGSEIVLFDNYKENGADGPPSLTLDSLAYTSNLTSDDLRDTLFASATVDSDSPFSIQIFDRATSLSDGAFPTRSLTGFPGSHPPMLAADPISDRLFALVVDETPSSTNENYLLSLHVFENASELESGDITEISHIVKSLTLRTQPFGLSYDHKSDRLYFGNRLYTGSGFYWIEEASAESTTAEAIELIEPGTGSLDSAPWYWDTFVDTVRDRLYVSDYFNARVLVFFNASQLTNSSPPPPDQVLQGTATQLRGPDGVLLVR